MSTVRFSQQLGAVLVATLLGFSVLTGCTAVPDDSNVPRGAGWQSYQDPDHDSSVAATRTGSGFIAVRFDNGATYTYTDASAGAEHVAAMQSLAQAGEGLGAYIQRFVRDRYASKS